LNGLPGVIGIDPPYQLWAPKARNGTLNGTLYLGLAVLGKVPISFVNGDHLADMHVIDLNPGVLIRSPVSNVEFDASLPGESFEDELDPGVSGQGPELDFRDHTSHFVAHAKVAVMDIAGSSDERLDTVLNERLGREELSDGIPLLSGGPDEGIVPALRLGPPLEQRRTSGGNGL
jgi:hypothetical protein